MSSLTAISLLNGWECYDWRNGYTILQHVHRKEWSDILNVLGLFRLMHSDIVAKGKGNKSAIAASIDTKFYGLGWVEHKFETSIVVDQVKSDSPTHAVDCFHGKIALELEWNNKDPFFDRDLNNFRLLFDLRICEVGVVVTRATSLQAWLNANHKTFGKQPGTYSVSTTHMDKLKPKIVGGGAGGCPVMIFAMTPALYVDDRPTPAPASSAP
ncbi:MAG: restriction endonuclease [Mesorhizobium sp.]|nr:BglII/BstYI family type II restriction endonuclease [Mesorhizobium sp.]MBL8575825.1 restriction endonuclease [Mesorhizobium sp.]